MFKISTLGCKVNQSESEAIIRQLESCDWSSPGNIGANEVTIINTCTVTQKAAMQSRQAVRQAIRANPNSRIVVTGCYAQTEPKAFEKINGVHYIIGNADKHRIGEILAAGPNSADGPAVTIHNDIRLSDPLKESPTVVCSSRTRPFLKIQDGCDAFCTYCIVPHARGPGRSLPVANVLNSIKTLSVAGYQEIVLTGIHLGRYGCDLIPATALCELLDDIDRSKLIQRVRLSSIEPLELTDDLIQRVADSRRFCRHFHIPLQSGDDRILIKMKRPYTADIFRQRVAKVRDQIPDAAIGVDTLIGFPGETDAAFSNTYDLINELPITYLHVFPFSARPGTPAARYPDPVAPDVIKKRCEKMRRLGQSKRLHFYRNFIGKTVEILVESTRHPATGLLKGISSNYIPVLINANDHQINTLVTVKLTDQIDNALTGTIV
ncbi:MAG: tRNA (N(6)-L-threonylcarbamoyladenosine(37)-C(2))-methylthiotransferase MtaB [Desulfobacterales bacterium]